MSALAVTTPIRTRAPRSTAPDCSRPRDISYRSRASVASCQVDRPTTDPGLRLTPRGVLVAMSTVGVVMGSAVVAIVSSFLSVSNLPL